MKKLILFSIVAFISATSFSQDKGGGTSFNVGLETGLPTGDFNKAQNIGFGLSAKAILSSGMTGSIGYLTYSGKNGNPAFNTVPLKAGYRIKTEGGFYFEPQVGVTFMSSQGESMNAFTWAPNVGLTSNSLDISVRYENISQSGESIAFLGLRVAYAFGSK